MGEAVVNKLLQQSAIVHAVEASLSPDSPPTSFGEAESANKTESSGKPHLYPSPDYPRYLLRRLGPEFGPEYIQKHPAPYLQN
jgi:hypothetical protein